MRGERALTALLGLALDEGAAAVKLGAAAPGARELPVDISCRVDIGDKAQSVPEGESLSAGVS
jgi:hypothetical protein